MGGRGSVSEDNMAARSAMVAGVGVMTWQIRAGRVLFIALTMLASSWGLPGVVRATSGTVHRNITYCTTGGQPLKLDLYQPTNGAPGPDPVVVYVHTGSWISGDKSQAANDGLVTLLRAKGFMVAAMNFSTVPSKRFPAQIRNLTCGVRFLRAHAVKFGLDKNRIGAVGMSGGGHLAAMLGVDDGSAMFVGAGFAKQSSAVQAVVDLWGVNDLTQHNLAPSDEEILPEIFGPDDLWASESPISYVRPDLPPFLLVHGDRDTVVPIRQSRAMYKALLAADDTVKFTVVHHAEHGLHPSGGTMSPSKAAIQKEIVAFFTAKLGRGNTNQAATN